MQGSICSSIGGKDASCRVVYAMCSKRQYAELVDGLP